MVDITYSKNFRYSDPSNPYHEKLEQFSDFVLRDHEGEKLRGKWNQQVFKCHAPIHVEIGSGYGNFMLSYCKQNPNVNFVGIDYRFKRSFQLAKKLSAHPYKNFRYLRAKGERIEFLFEPNEVDRFYYFFPDPWPKTRHKKKRLFQSPFLEAAYKILAPNGELHIKTDHDDYAKWMINHFENENIQNLFHCELKTLDLYNEYPQHSLTKFQTKFENIFLKQKIPIKAFVLKSKKKALCL